MQDEMTVAAWLRQPEKLKRRIRLETDQITRLKDTLGSLGITDYSLDRVTSSPDPDPPYVRALLLIDTYQGKLLEDLELLDRLNCQIGDALCGLRKGEAEALWLRVTENRSLRGVARDLAVSLTTAHRWYLSALENITLPEDAIWI